MAIVSNVSEKFFFARKNFIKNNLINVEGGKNIPAPILKEINVSTILQRRIKQQRF